MRLTKTALGLLNNQYRSVLKKCFLINMGVLAFAIPTHASNVTIPGQPTIDRLHAEDASAYPNESGYSFVKSGANTNKAITEYVINEDTGEIISQTTKYVNIEKTTYTDSSGGQTLTYDWQLNGLSVTTSNTKSVSPTPDGEGNYIGDFISSVLSVSDSSNISLVNANFVKSNPAAYIYGDVTTLEGNFIGANLRNYGTITNLTADFLGGTAYQHGGAIRNYAGASIENLKGDFIGNGVTSTSLVSGGAIRNEGYIGSIEGNFIANRAVPTVTSNAGSGGAIRNQKGYIGDINGYFSGNVSKSGGAIQNENQSKIDKITGWFVGNQAINSVAGAINNSNSSYIGEIDAKFIANTATNSGGAIFNENSSMITSINGLFSANTSGQNGGAIYNGGNSEIDLVTGKFVNNEARNGGAIYNYKKIGYVSADFNGNKTTGSFTSGTPGSGGAYYGAKGASADMLDGDFVGNSAVNKGGAVFVNNGSADISGNFLNNTAELGGAISLYDSSKVNIIAETKNVLFEGNTDETGSNAVYFEHTGTAEDNILNLNAADGYSVVVNDGIRGVKMVSDTPYTNQININKNDSYVTVTGRSVDLPVGGTYEINNSVAGASLALYNNATLKLGKNTQGGTDYYGVLDLSTPSSYTTKFGFSNDDQGGVLDMVNDDHHIHDLGETTLNSTLGLKLDLDATTKTADLLIVDATSAGIIRLDEFNWAGGVRDFDGLIQILDNQNSTNLIELDINSSGKTHITEVEKYGTDDLLTNSIQWDDTFGAYKYTETTTRTYSTGQTKTQNDSLSMTKTIVNSPKTYDPKADNLALINQYDGAGSENRSFEFDSEDNIFNVTVNSGVSTSGTLSINGVEQDGKRSTIEYGDHSMMEVGSDVHLIVNNTAIKGSQTLSSKGEVTLNNSQFNSEIQNDGKIGVDSKSFVFSLINNQDAENAGEVALATNAGSLNNSGEITKLLNNGAVDNNGEIIKLSNNGTVDNSGEIIKLSNNGTVDNSGMLRTVTNSATLNMWEGSDFETIDGNGVVNLYGAKDLGTRTISGNTVNKYSGTLNINSSNLDENVQLNAEDGAVITISDNTIKIKTAQFGSGSVLDLAVNSLSDHGLFAAETITIDEGAKLHAVLAQGIVGVGETADIELLRASNSNFNKFTDVFENNMYKFEKKDLNGWYTIKQVKTAEDVAKESGGTKTNEEAAAAWVDGPAFSGGSAVADGLAALAQNDGKAFNKELTALAPNDAPVVQGVSAQIHDILLKRVSYQLRHGTSAEGISSGDEGKGVSLWAEGYGGKSKLQRRGDHYGFSTDSKGVIIGLDKKIGSAIKIGAGFQYDETEVDGYRRDTDVDTETVFAYGEYKPNQWFARGLLSYSMSDYNEKKRVLGNSYRADYSADTYSAQAISGYDMGYVTPLGGLKYYHIKRHGYEDGLGQEVSGKDMDILTAVGGVRLAKEYTLACGHSIKPEAYLGVSYDLKSDRDNAVVGVANGASYTVHGKRLPRFGVEFNAGLTAELTDRLSANVNYLGAYRDDYQDHTGLIGLKYSF